MGNTSNTKKNNFLDKIVLTDSYENFTLNMTKLIKNPKIDWTFNIHDRTDEELNIYEGVIKNFIFYSTDYLYKYSKKKKNSEKIFLRMKNFITILNNIFVYYSNREDVFFEFYDILWEKINNDDFLCFDSDEEKENGRFYKIKGSIDKLIRSGEKYEEDNKPLDTENRNLITKDEDIKNINNSEIDNENNSENKINNSDKEKNNSDEEKNNSDEEKNNLDKLDSKKKINSEEEIKEKKLKFSTPIRTKLKKDKSSTDKQINIMLKLLISLDRLITKNNFSITQNNINWINTKVTNKIQQNRKAILELITTLIKLEQKFIKKENLKNNSIISFFKFHSNYTYLVKSLLNNALVKYNKKIWNLKSLVYKEYFLLENDIVILILNFCLFLIKSNSLGFYKEFRTCDRNYRNIFVVKNYLIKNDFLIDNLEGNINNINIVNNSDIILLIVNILNNIFVKEKVIPDLVIKVF